MHRRASFVSGMLLGLAVGLAVGHVTVWRASPLSSVSSEQEALLPEAPIAHSAIDPTHDQPLGSAWDVHDPHLVTAEAVDAEANKEVDTEAAVKRTARSETGVPPAQFQPPDNLTRIDTESLRDEELTRSIIAEEVPEATDEEREVWLDVLKGLPAPDMRGILRMQKRFGRLQPDALRGELPPTPVGAGDGSPVVGPLPPGPEEFALPPSEESEHAPPHDQAIATLHLARDVVRNNIANAHSRGFYRVEPMLTDLPYLWMHRSAEQASAASGLIAVGSGCQCLATTLDVRPGPLHETDRVLDLAIDGSGFFAVEADGDMFYTRRGRFTIDGAGRLALPTGLGVLPLRPTITVRERSLLAISPDGRVLQSKLDEDAPNDVGRIELVLFADPSRLQPRGDGLLAMTPQAGIPQREIPSHGGAGVLRQEMLEHSNVDLAAEHALLEDIELQLQALEPSADAALR